MSLYRHSLPADAENPQCLHSLASKKVRLVNKATQTLEMADTQLHILTAQSPDLDATLLRIIAFSNGNFAFANDIFVADSTTKYGSLSYWKGQLSHPSSKIIYITADAPGEDTISPVVGFIFAHPRTHTPPLPFCNASETLHIWLAGVSPQHRKAGCLRRMVDALLAREDDGLVVSVCTLPERFSDMWAWLNKRGWRVEREMGGGKICLSQPLSHTAA